LVHLAIPGCHPTHQPVLFRVLVVHQEGQVMRLFIMLMETLALILIGYHTHWMVPLALLFIFFVENLELPRSWS
jgi:hypothetical protein